MGNKLIDSDSYGFKNGVSLTQYNNDMSAVANRIAELEGKLSFGLSTGENSVDIVSSGERMIVSGMLTSGKATIIFSVPVVPDLTEPTSITARTYTLKANIRSVAGGFIVPDDSYPTSYVDGGTDFGTGTTVTVSIGTKNCLEVKIQPSSGTFYTAASNNTPISVEINRLAVTMLK